MLLAENPIVASWHKGTSPLALGEILSSSISVAIWKRPVNPVVSQYFEQTFSRLGMGVRGVFSMNTLQEELRNALPQHPGLDQAADDIYLLCDMLTCLFDCDSVGLRLVPLTTTMCPKFHADNIPVRLVSTYLGPGTEWLPLEALEQPMIATRSDTNNAPFAEGRYKPEHIQQMAAFDVGLLKGKAWEQQEHMAAVHRSCQVAQGDKRVLLTLDPM